MESVHSENKGKVLYLAFFCGCVGGGRGIVGRNRDNFGGSWNFFKVSLPYGGGVGVFLHNRDGG